MAQYKATQKSGPCRNSMQTRYGTFRRRAALEKGTIDAAEWIGPHDDEKLGFHKIARFYYSPGWWEGGTLNHMFVNIDKWNSLPSTYKAILQSACDRVNVWTQANFD